MKINWNTIKMVLLLCVVAALYAFGTKRNGKRPVKMPKIEFLGEGNLFITHETVSKLLIQNQEEVTSVTKETLALNELEVALNKNPMVESAEVFLGVNGDFSAEIKQKTPIARVFGGQSYYVDSYGLYMPLSKNYTERVPLITGYVNKDALETVFEVANTVYNDEFLKKNVVEIEQAKDKSIRLKLRQCNFTVHVGNLSALEKKMTNLKVFYAKAMKDKTFNNYSIVNLQFENQVVCTKV